MLGSNADEHPDVPRDVRAEDVDVAEAIEKINTITTLSVRRVLKQWGRVANIRHQPPVGRRARPN